MQPYFFPYLGYFQLMNLVDTYVVYDDVCYIKGGYVNRNWLLANGKKQQINLVLSGASPNLLFKEIEVSSASLWRKKLLTTIHNAYIKAPYFEQVLPIIKEVINNPEPALSLYLLHSFEVIAEYLSINTKFVLSSSIPKDNMLKGQDKVLAMCKELKCSTYINAIGGQSLYSNNDFLKNNIKLDFIKMGDIKYKQFNNEFIPFLSIIDVLMFNSKEQVKGMLKQYEFQI